MATFPSVTSYSPAAASTTAYAASVTGASFTLTNTSSGDGLARQISILNNTATNHSGKTITIVGTDADGYAQTETITGPGSSATVVSTKFYLTLTSVTPSATIGADTFSIGTNGLWVTPTIALNARNANAANIQALLSGTMNFTVSQLYDDVLLTTSSPAQSANWTAITALSAKTATTVGSAAVGATAIRLSTASYSTTPTISLTINQPWTMVRA